MTTVGRLEEHRVFQARSHARNVMGAELARKASDHFCLAMLIASGRNRSWREAGKQPPRASLQPNAAVPSILEFAAHGAATPGIASSSGVSSSIGETRATVPPQMAGVLEELERRAHGPWGRTDVCWLNRSVRTWVSPSRFADLTADPAIVAVDLPQRLQGHDVRSRGGDAFAPSTKSSDSKGQRPARNGHEAVRLRPGLELAGAGPVVAVIDSEVAAGHACLEGRVVHRANLTTEPWGLPHQHGTAMAGIIASVDPGFPGIAPGVVVYNYKVLAAGRRHDADDFGAALALQYALEDGVAVALCAWGAGPIGPGPSRLARALDQAWALGMVVVKSAGNGGPRRHTMSSPAEADGVLVVGATDLWGTQVQPYSSRGPVGARLGPHLVAPGGTWGTDPSTRLTCARLSGGFRTLDVGTSYAAAFVVGATALHLDRDPTLRPDAVRHRLVREAIPLASNQGIEAQGAGLLQIEL